MTQLNPIPMDTQVNYRMPTKFNQRTGDSPYAHYPNQR